MNWISVKDRPIPRTRKYISGYCLPAISKLYGYGVIVMGSNGKWSFTTDHKSFHVLSHVTYWMPLPEPPEDA